MDSAVKLNELQRKVDSLLARVRELEARVPSQGLRVSAKGGQTKVVRLSDDGESLEVES